MTTDIPIHCAHSKIADPRNLIANPRNPNKHPDRQIATLAEIIRAQGWRNPITVSKRSGFVVTGHGRLAAALLLGTNAVPVDEQDFANDAAEWAHLIADNRLAELAEIDEGELKQMLADLKLEDGFDLSLTGFDEHEIEGMLAGIDTLDAEPSEAKEQAHYLRIGKRKIEIQAQEEAAILAAVEEAETDGAFVAALLMALTKQK